MLWFWLRVAFLYTLLHPTMALAATLH